jgi:dihydroneopterin aldolase
MTDRILLVGLRFFGYHGALPEERTRGQEFIVDVEVEAALAAAGRSDALGDTVDYREVYEAARVVTTGVPKQLLEAVAEEIAGRVLALEHVAAVTVRVRKPRAPLPTALDYAAVEVRRSR